MIRIILARGADPGEVWEGATARGTDGHPVVELAPEAARALASSAAVLSWDETPPARRRPTAEVVEDLRDAPGLDEPERSR